MTLEERIGLLENYNQVLKGEIQVVKKYFIEQQKLILELTDLIKENTNGHST